MVSPTEIANMAFAPTADSLNQTNQFYSQLALQRAAQQQNQKLQQDKVNDQFNSELLNKIAASGTPADEVIINEGNLAMKAIADFGKANPRASDQMKREYARQVVAPVMAKNQMAKSAFDELKARESLTAKEYPFLNLPNYRKAFSQKFIYDNEGNVKKDFDLSVLNDPDLDLGNIDNLERFTNESALNPLVQKMYKDGMQPSARAEQVTDDRGNIVDVKYKAIPNIQKLNADASGIEFNTNLVNVGDKTYETFSDEIDNPFKDDPKFEIAKRKLIKTLKSENEALGEAPQSVVDAIATTELTKRFASSEASDINKSYSTQSMINTERQRAISNARDAERDARARRAELRNIETHKKNIANSKYEPQGIYSAIVAGTMRNKEGDALIPEEQARINKAYGIPFSKDIYNAIMPSLSEDSKQTLKSIADKSGNIPIAKASSILKMVDLSAAKGGMLTDFNRMQPYKLYSITNNDNNEVTLARVYYTVDDKGKPIIDDGTEIDVNGKIKEGTKGSKNPYQVIKNNEDEMLYIQSQFKGTPQRVLEQEINPMLTSNEVE